MALCSLSSCFTGVESTPRIDASDVRRNNAGALSAEDAFFSSIHPSPLAQWTPGKVLRVSDPRIRLVLSPGSTRSDLKLGDELVFRRVEPVNKITGTEGAEIMFTVGATDTVYYRPGSDLDAVMAADAAPLEIPFTVDVDMAAEADSIVAADRRPVYVITPLWYDAFTEKATAGYRHIEVELDSVRPGNHLYPLAVYFHVADPEYAGTEVGKGEKMMFLTANSKVGGGTRGFGTLFSFQDSRKRFPNVSREIWHLIVNSQVREGMTKDECRLALGAPSSVERTPVRNGDLERWSYSDGVFLLFNTENILIRYRL